MALGARAALAVGLCCALWPAGVDATERVSVSVGDAEHGRIEGSAQMPRCGPGYQRLSVVARRGTGYGTQMLVDLVERVARGLRDAPGHAAVPLRVGNLSLRGGGEMRWSHSHRSGRDVDLVFYVLDRRGQPLSPDGFVHFDADGVGAWRGRRVRFDVPRNWRLVRALLTDTLAPVQHLFVAEPLRRQLLDHARALGEPEWLLQRARVVLSEPAHAGTHDDHLHVRIYCGLRDVAHGCVDTGPRWSWVPDFGRAAAPDIDRDVAALGEPDVSTRRRAAERLGGTAREARRAFDALVYAAAHDDDAQVRHIALGALARGERPGTVAAVLRVAAQRSDAARVRELADAAIAASTPADAPLLLGLLGPDAAGLGATLGAAHRSAVRAAVARRVRPWMLEAAAAPLVRALDDPQVSTQRAVLRTLEVLANRRFRHVDAARRWHELDGHRGRLHWMYEGFAHAGVAVHGPPHLVAPVLIERVRGRDSVLAANAEALLRRIIGGPPTAEVETARRRHRAWTRWWTTHRQRFQWSEATATAGD
jgi:penicillin-insensitive murein endopeptidase